MKQFFVYIMANKRNGTLYTGVTNDLLRRVLEHKNKLTESFSSRYSLDKLVYFEPCIDVNSAIRREKQLKSWNRKWKLYLIEKNNPNWIDLSEDLLDPQIKSEDDK